MQYLRARYYDPGTGRFLSRDPLMIGNRYSYVGNNPLNYIDPYGLFGIPGTGIDIDIPDPSDIIDPVVDIIAPVVDFASTYSTVVSILDLVPASPWYIEVANGVLTQLNIMTSDCSTATKIRLTLMNGLNIGAGIGGTVLLPPAAAVAGPVGVGAVVTVTFAVEAGLATANQVIIDGCSNTVYANSGHRSNPKE